MSKTTDSISSTCTLCCQDMKLFAIGPCDHPICSKCSTRMRVLCGQKYCAVCRLEMATVVFVKKLHPYASIISHKFLLEKNAGIRFATMGMKNEFDGYQLHKCNKCPNDVNIFKTMKLLQDHMRKTHELFYCNICLDNVKVFTSERPLYNRRDLAIHKRKGDSDNTSYRGHPLCEFCDTRFFDNDELLKHLRRQHYYCHFCENDGISNQYYDNYENLREHFRERHYLCEEGECINEEFTSAFRSEIDMKAHVASKHTSKMSKKEARQVRQLDWEFNYTSHRSNQRDGVISGADYAETRGSYREHRGRGHGARYNNHSTREFVDTARAVDASLQLDTVKEQRPPKKRDEPRVEKMEKDKKPHIKPDDKKQKPVKRIKEDAFEKYRSVENSTAERQKEVPPKTNTHKNNHDDLSVDWSMGNHLSSQFTESTWTGGGEPPKLSNTTKFSTNDKTPEEAVEKSLDETKPIHCEPSNSKVKVIEETELPKKSDFPALSAKHLPAAVSSWNRSLPTDADAFPSLGSAAKPPKHQIVTESRLSSVKPAFTVDFSKAIAENAKSKVKKTQLFKPPQPPPPTQSYKDFPTLSSIASILNIAETKQKKPKNKPPVVVCATKAQTPRTARAKPQISKVQPVEPQYTQEKSEIAKRANPPEVDRATNAETNKTRMPPGFNETSMNVPKQTQPPGFTSLPQAPPGLDLGTKLIPPPGFSGQSSFLEPFDFKQRNLNLVQQIQIHLNNDSAKFNVFKTLSGQFRHSTMSAKEYYEKCDELLGTENFQSIFPDLVSLLPDTIKQQELLQVNNDYKITAKATGEWILPIKKANKKGKGSVWNKHGQNDNTQCNNCGQVILLKDLAFHTSSCSSNLNTDFPSLRATASAATPSQVASAWGRVK